MEPFGYLMRVEAVGSWARFLKGSWMQRSGARYSALGSRGLSLKGGLEGVPWVLSFVHVMGPVYWVCHYALGALRLVGFLCGLAGSSEGEWKACLGALCGAVCWAV